MIYPMLAKAPTKAKPFTGDFDTFFGPNWVYEPKYDGMRIISDKGVLTSRIGTLSNARFPEIDLSGIDAILDGEMVILGEDDKPDFNAIQRRTPKTAATDRIACYMIFDVLQYGSRNLRGLPQAQRRKLLESIILPPHCYVAPQVSLSGAQLFYDNAMALGLEGIIAKNQTGCYYEGHRSKDWVKIKRKMSLSCVVTGWEDGLGKREDTFGALSLSLYDDTGTLVDVGSVGTGFTDLDLEDVMDLLGSGQTLVVEIECMEVTKDKKLRFPVYKGVRDDVPMMACTIDQLV
jgi:bifunctional non-homologous end joining protein LigD